MPFGAQLRLPARVGTSAAALAQRCPQRPYQPCGRRLALLVRASAEGPAGGAAPDEGPREISLVRRVPGVGATFILAGALKILTIGWVATGAPRECVRTAAGQWSQFMLIPVGLLLCLIAKKVVDAGLHESRRFMTFVLGVTALLYFGLYSVLYRYEPRSFYAQQRIQAAAAHLRSPYAEEAAPGARRSDKFIIQRQLEGEYDAHTSAYYNRAPEMQMEDVEARMSGLPAGVINGVGSSGRGEAAAPEAALGVGSTVAERRAGGMSALGRAQRRVAVAPPSIYDSSARIPGLEDSEF